MLPTPQVICMVGLPARGKTYISRKLARYLTWIGVSCRVFNVGEYRRRETSDSSHHEFFLSTNMEVRRHFFKKKFLQFVVLIENHL